MGANDLALPSSSRGGSRPLSRAEKLRRLKLHREAWNRQARRSFLRYCQHPDLWGDEIPQIHHEHVCSAVSRVETGEIKRLMIFMPPGSAKSTYTTHRFASWYMGKHPTHSLITASHGAELAEEFGYRVRNTVGHSAFGGIFPGVTLAADSKSKGHWHVSDGDERAGQYFAVGMTGGIAGRRANGILIDDPFKNIEDADSQVRRDKVWNTYKTDLRSRLKGDQGWIIIIQTRWHVDDLSGRILPDNWDGESGWVTAKDGEEWYVLRIAMECDSKDDPLGRKLGETLWPEWWSPKYVAREKLIQGTRNWNALYQGRPTTDEGAIIKAAYWRKWPSETPPVCEYVLQSIDGAFEEDEESDYSARTTWGIFDVYAVENTKVLQALIDQAGKGEVQRYHAILLEAWRGKVPFHTFKRVIKDGFSEYEADRLLIEKKASGHSLIQEMRRGGIPVKAMKADRSKTARTHAAEPAFEQGCIWHMPFDWSLPVRTECAQFPNGQHDDWHDTVTQAVNYLRRLYHLLLKDEDEDDDEEASKDARETEKPIYG